MFAALDRPSSSRSGARRPSTSGCAACATSVAGGRLGGRSSSSPSGSSRGADRDLRQARRPGARQGRQGRGLARRPGRLLRADLPGRAVRRGAVLPRLHVHRAVAQARPVVGGADRRRSCSGSATRPRPAVSLVALGAFGVGLCLLYWRTAVHSSVHGPPRAQQFDHVRRGQRPRPRALRRGRRRSASASSPPAPTALSAARRRWPHEASRSRAARRARPPGHRLRPDAAARTDPDRRRRPRRRRSPRRSRPPRSDTLRQTQRRASPAARSPRGS